MKFLGNPPFQGTEEGSIVKYLYVENFYD